MTFRIIYETLCVLTFRIDGIRLYLNHQNSLICLPTTEAIYGAQFMVLMVYFSTGIHWISEILMKDLHHEYVQYWDLYMYGSRRRRHNSSLFCISILVITTSIWYVFIVHWLLLVSNTMCNDFTTRYMTTRYMTTRYMTTWNMTTRYMTTLNT